MDTNEKEKNFEKYNEQIHRLGRITTVITLILLLGAPFAIGAYLGEMPDLIAFIKAFLSIGLIYLISGVVEYLIYVPMLGTGGSYLAFITGNLINMKIPCAINARDIAGAKSGTPENEIVSTLSIASSSLVTIAILAIGVMCLIPLQPVLQSETLQPAFANVVPALFGAMACRYYRRDLPVAAATLLMMTALFIFVPSLISSASFMIIPGGAAAIGLSYLKFRKNRKEDAV